MYASYLFRQKPVNTSQLFMTTVSESTNIDGISHYDGFNMYIFFTYSAEIQPTRTAGANSLVGVASLAYLHDGPLFLSRRKKLFGTFQWEITTVLY